MNRKLLSFAALLLATQAIPAADAELERLAEARERWQAAGAGDYRYAYRRFCECYRDQPPEIVVTVQNGRVRQVIYRYESTGTEAPADADNLADYYTIDDLFDKLSAAYAREAEVEAEYDPELGFPARLFIDDFSDFSGDETDLRLSGVEIL